MSREDHSPIILNELHNNNKRGACLHPVKCIPPSGDEHAKLKAEAPNIPTTYIYIGKEKKKPETKALLAAQHSALKINSLDWL